MTIHKTLRAVILVCLAFTTSACGLLDSAPAKSAIDIARDPAIDLLTRVISDRYGSDVHKGSAYCEETDAGFKSGIEELDDEEQGAFVLCWARGEN